MSRAPNAPGTRGGGRTSGGLTLAEGLLLLVLSVLLQPVLLSVAVATGAVGGEGSATDRVVVVVIQAGVLLAAVGWLAARRRLRTAVAPRPQRTRPGRDVALGLGTGVAAFGVLVVAVGALYQLLGGVDAPEQQALTDLASGGLSAAMALVLALVLAPLLEELVFRAGLYQGLRAHVGPWPAALVSSGLFALVHIEVLLSSPLFLIQLFALALVFAWLLERTGSLLAPVVAHLAFNATSMAVAAGAPTTAVLAPVWPVG